MSLSENRYLLAQILSGNSPSAVLSMMLQVAHDLDKYALADIFLERFDRLEEKWGQTTFRKRSENVVCPLFTLKERN